MFAQQNYLFQENKLGIGNSKIASIIFRTDMTGLFSNCLLTPMSSTHLFKKNSKLFFKSNKLLFNNEFYMLGTGLDVPIFFVSIF